MSVTINNNGKGATWQQIKDIINKMTPAQLSETALVTGPFCFTDFTVIDDFCLQTVEDKYCIWLGDKLEDITP